MKLRRPTILMVPEFPPSFFDPDRLHCCYIDFHYSYLCISTIIPLEPCALNARNQRFVLSFSISYWDLIKFPNITDTTKRGVRGWKEAQRQVNWRISLMWPKVQHIFGELGTRTKLWIILLLEIRNLMDIWLKVDMVEIQKHQIQANSICKSIFHSSKCALTLELDTVSTPKFCNVFLIFLVELVIKQKPSFSFEKIQWTNKSKPLIFLSTIWVILESKADFFMVFKSYSYGFMLCFMTFFSCN